MQPLGDVARWTSAPSELRINRLKTAVVRLRSLLAAQGPGLPGEVVRLGRDGICRLDTTLVSSDVRRFAVLCHTARRLAPPEAKAALQEARALYRSDLLAGPTAQGYEWVEARDHGGISLREHYREEYYHATRHLARLHFRDGRPDLAVPLYKSLLKLDPTLQDVVRELYRCYRELGDLGSLVREDRQLRQALREAYADPDDPADDPECCQPEPQTFELFRKIREELEAKATL